MGNQTMTEKQYNLLAQLNNVIEAMAQEDEEFQGLVNDADILGGDVDDVVGDIESRIEIVSLIKRYDAGEITDTGVIGISNTMGVVIVDYQSDYVFGYLPFESGKKFFLSEVEYKIDEDDEDEDSVPMFTIGEDGMELNLNHAMRIGGGR